MEDHRAVRRCGVLALVGVALLVSSAASAQGRRAKTTQKQLNDQATQAAAAGEYDKALLFLRSALELGELNVTYLNLGRVYQLQGSCAEADAAYARALEAPQVPNPPASVIAEVVGGFRAELRERCPGTVEFSCDPEGLELLVDGAPARCGEPVKLALGEHVAVGALAGERAEVQVSVAGWEPQVVRVVVTPPAPEVVTPPVVEAPPPEPGWSDQAIYRVTGFALGGLALGAAVTGGVIRWSYQPAVDELQELAATPGGSASRYEELRGVVSEGEGRMLLSLGAAGLLGVGSGVLLVLGFTGDDAPSAARLVPWWGAGMGGVSGAF